MKLEDYKIFVPSLGLDMVPYHAAKRILDEQNLTLLSNVERLENAIKQIDVIYTSLENGIKDD